MAKKEKVLDLKPEKITDEQLKKDYGTDNINIHTGEINRNE